MRALVRRARVAALAGAIAGGFTAAQSARAQSTPVTIDSVLRALEAGAQRINFAALDPARSNALVELHNAWSADPSYTSPISDVVNAAGTSPHSMRIVFRWNRDAVERASRAALKARFLRLNQIATAANVGLGPRIFATIPNEYPLYAGVLDSLNTLQVELAQRQSTARLQRYEIKFGPAAPKLNPLETLLNWTLERLPGPFAPDVNGPSPYELVTSYSSGDVTASGAFKTVPLKVLSGAHLGIRVYQFGDTASYEGTWSTRGIVSRLMRPGNVAVGVSSFAAKDLPLQTPFGSGRRLGGFFDWGRLRAAAALGHNWRAIVGTGVQLVPHVF